MKLRASLLLFYDREPADYRQGFHFSGCGIHYADDEKHQGNETKQHRDNREDADENADRVVRQRAPMFYVKGKMNFFPLIAPDLFYARTLCAAMPDGALCDPSPPHGRGSYRVLFRSTVYISSAIRRPVATIVFFLLIP
ncbi:MAG: hypothetical protein LBC99_04080 [Spirochaetota bacterium]|jgi:hypothetical protein|nr:hypothetical protein [Spirochaetota bacterium]